MKSKKYISYYDLVYAQTTIFEAEEIKDHTPDQIQEAEKIFNTVLDRIQNGDILNEDKNENDEKFDLILDKLNNGGIIDEGILSGLAGGAAGALAGPAVGKAICKALGIDQKGHLGKLLNSRVVTTAIGWALAK